MNDPQLLRDPQRGIALLASLLGLLLLTILGLGLTSVAIVSVTTSGNERESTEVFYLADSGLAHAHGLITANGGTLNSYLTAGNGTGCTGDEFSTQPSNPIPAAGQNYWVGSYRVSACDDNDDGNADSDSNNRILIRSVGTGRNGASATVEMQLTSSMIPALLIDGNLNISGKSAPRRA